MTVAEQLSGTAVGAECAGLLLIFSNISVEALYFRAHMSYHKSTKGGRSVPGFDILDSLVHSGNGLLRTADAVAAGISKPMLGNYVRVRGLERVGHGLYLAPDAWKDGMYLIQLRCPQAVFSHDTALFLHDLTDREPSVYTVTVKSGYNPHRLKEDGIKVYRIKADLHGLGRSQTNTPFGNPVAVYDLERTVCDVIRSRSSMDIQIFRDALRRFVDRRDKDLRRLMHYARAFHVESIMRQYLEVLL